LLFPFNISATTEDSDFEIGRQMGFAKAHHKISPRRKSERVDELGELPKILMFSFNISATAKASDFKFNMQLGLAKAYQKITRRRKVGVAWFRVAP